MGHGTLLVFVVLNFVPQKMMCEPFFVKTFHFHSLDTVNIFL